MFATAELFVLVFRFVATLQHKFLSLIVLLLFVSLLVDAKKTVGMSFRRVFWLPLRFNGATV